MTALHFFYQRSPYGGWMPVTSPDHPDTLTRDGRKIITTGHVELTAADLGLTLHALAKRYPPPGAAPEIHTGPDQAKAPDEIQNDPDLRDDFRALVAEAMARAGKAIVRYPQPNYVISKIAEEAGEVVKAAIHCAEGRDTLGHVRDELVDLIAMAFRLYAEGDRVHGLPPVWRPEQRARLDRAAQT